MTEELRRAMETEAGSAATPEVAGVWRAGRRRRSTRRWITAVGSVGAVLLLAGVATRVLVDENAETVRAGRASASCTPVRGFPNEDGFVLSDELAGPAEAPKTAAAMVRGGGSEHLRKPEVVARVKVLSTEVREVSREQLASVDSTGSPASEVRAWVEVTDPVFGADVGDRFTISDAKTAQLADLKNAKKVITQQIDDRQNQVNDLNRPLEALDEQIRDTPADDPGYQALVNQREDVKRRVDTARTAAQDQLNDYQQRLQILQLSERLSPMPVGTSCHRFEEGDDLVVALVRPDGGGTFELTGPSSFFLVDGNGFSEDLDAARRSVPGWSDSELLRLARESSVDEFLDRLREAADH